MYENVRVAVVIPAYNEESHVGTVIETVPAFVDVVYVIDDGSVDGTWDEIERHATHIVDETDLEHDLAPWAEEGPRPVVAMRHEPNRGRGRCIKDGYHRALADGIDVVAVMDGDGQMDPAELHRIIDPITKGRADYSKGTRLQDRSHVRGMSKFRLFGNLLLSLLTNLSSGYWGMLDSQNGYTAISRRALETIPIETLYDGYGFLNDLLTTLNVHGLRLVEVSHPAVYDDEESGISYASFIPAVSLLLLRNFLFRLQQRYVVKEFHATIVCYGVGSLGLLTGIANLAATLVTGSIVPVTGLSTPVLLVTGLVVFLLAIALDVQQNSDLTERIDSTPTGGH